MRQWRAGGGPCDAPLFRRGGGEQDICPKGGPPAGPFSSGPRRGVGRAHALALRSDGRTYTLRVPAGGRASTSIPGLRAGRYRLAPVGGGPGATLIVGGQVAPEAGPIPATRGRMAGQPASRCATLPAV